MKYTLIILFILLSSMLVLAKGSFSCQELLPSSTQELLHDTVQLNKDLEEGCPIRGAQQLIKNGKIQVHIIDVKDLTITIKEGFITTITQGALDNPSYIITTDECTLDTILRAEQPEKAAAYFILNKDVTIKPKGLFNSMKYTTIKPFLKNTLNRIQEPTVKTCSNA